MTDKPTLAEQIACVKREIALRERCYPRWILEREMSQQKADAELVCMRAVLKTLTNLQANSIAQDYITHPEEE